MDLACKARALRFLGVCLAEFSLEIITMGGLLYAFYGFARSLYAFAAILANVPRVLLAAVLVVLVPQARYRHETARGRERPFSLVGPWPLGSWCLSSLLISVFYLITVFTAQDPLFVYMMGVLAFINILICVFSPFLLCAPPAGAPRTAVKTFTYRSEAGPEEPPSFGTSCCICLSDLDEGELVGQLPCQHVFHEPCIRQWLVREDCCPMRCAAPQGALEATTRAAASPAGSGEAEAAAAAAWAAFWPAWATRRRQRAARRTAEGQASGGAAVGQGQAAAPEEVEDWADEQVSVDLSRGRLDVVLHPRALL